MEEQDSDETKALLTTLFRGAEHEQAQANLEPVEAATEKMEPIFEGELDRTDNYSYCEDAEDMDNSIAIPFYLLWRH